MGTGANCKHMIRKVRLGRGHTYHVGAKSWHTYHDTMRFFRDYGGLGP